jgi:hypothetical protein
VEIGPERENTEDRNQRVLGGLEIPEALQKRSDLRPIDDEDD